MKWFEGSIPEAIQLAKSQKSLFIVFITGDDEASREMTKAWDDITVDQLSLTNKCVGLKLEAKSQPGIQFAQIYPVMVVPSVFFIAPETGLPLEVSMGQVDGGQLQEKLNKAIEMQQSSAPSVSSEHSSTSALDSAAKNEKTVGATGGHSVSTEPSGSSSHSEAAYDDTDDLLREGETLEEQKERLLKKMAERRELKAQQEEENEKKREMERRKLGQETQKFHQWKAEMEKKEFENSYKKEKEEQKRALEKVRADLERDRQERAVKYRQEKDLQQEATERTRKAKLEAEAKRLERENAMKRESSRIQFRLPDGSSVTQVFAATDTLATARNFIQQKLNNKPVTLSTTYPKKTFVDSDMTRTLLDLELVPSSVLIVLPEASRRLASPATPETDNTSFFWMLLAPLLALWNFIYAFLFPQPVNRQESQNINTSQNRQTGLTSDGGSSSTQQQSRSQGLRSRKVGNMNRLTADDEDDDSATWNGNSTQQM